MRPTTKNGSEISEKRCENFEGKKSTKPSLGPKITTYTVKKAGLVYYSTILPFFKPKKPSKISKNRVRLEKLSLRNENKTQKLSSKVLRVKKKYSKRNRITFFLHQMQTSLEI